MKYIQCKVFKDIPASEQEYFDMKANIPQILSMLIESNDYFLTYLAEDDVQPGEIWIAPYGKRTKIVVAGDVTDDIKDDIAYRELIKKIDHVSNL